MATVSDAVGTAEMATETEPMAIEATGVRKKKKPEVQPKTDKVTKAQTKAKQQKNGVYQFKITLLTIKPPIWRRIQVPEDYTFFDLHVAIQNAMGWGDCHLHQFKVSNPKFMSTEIIGIPDHEEEEEDDGGSDCDDEKEDDDEEYDRFGFGFDEDKVRSGRKVKISSRFLSPKDTAMYVYDLGFEWDHEVVFEKIEPKVGTQSYPRCLAGKRACPPEDCGGWGGSYEDLIEAVRNPNHPDHKEKMELVGGPFDPEAFDPKSVVFQDPKNAISYGFFNC